MAYKYEQKINDAFFRENRAGGNVNNEVLAELQEVYRKAKAWDRMHELLIDKDIPCKEFDDEMYELLKKTGKTDIRIITDSNIDLGDE